MKNRPVRMIVRSLVGVVAVCTLVPWVAVAGQKSIDQQLIEAAGRGDVERVKGLLKRGANVNGQDQRGRTALMAAAYRGHLAELNILLDRGADINARDRRGQTPLLWGAYKGHSQAVEAVVKNAADCNAKDEHGWTPLMMASLQGHIQIVRVLLEKGADVSAKNYRDNTALKIAANKGHTDIAELLKSREQIFANWAVLFGTGKLVVVFIILGIIAGVPHDRPLTQLFFERQKWLFAVVCG